MPPDGPRKSPYPKLDPRPDYPRMETATIAYWEGDATFRASVDASPPGTDEFVFYDGPPFANGLPHYGHLLTGFVKDAVGRFWTMRKRRVERRFGWDCHGLPAEMAAEKDLQVSGKAAISAFGVDRFNAHCQALVDNTTDAWEKYVRRQARWVDIEHPYRTMDPAYMESVIWAFKRLYDTGLLYEGERVLPYCWECETPLSNFETRQDDSYRERIDMAVTVAFRIKPADDATTRDPTIGGRLHSSPPGTIRPGPSLDGELRLLVWTTTPWTLPSNLALAVGPDITYGAYLIDGQVTLLAETRAAAYPDQFGGLEPLFTVVGRDLAGRTYEPLFNFFANTPDAFRILAADFVDTEEGTGVVHLAPGFGEEDFEACTRAGLPVICPVDERGRFTPEVPRYSGMQVFDANRPILDDLAAAGVIFHQDAYAHSYPHCWRTDTPLIYKAVSSWFVNVTALKDRLLERNQDITWVPTHVRDGAFGKWLEGARDWSISRNRFWGTPIPVWKSDDPAFPRVDVYGSLEELAADFGHAPADLHMPAIDELTRPNPDDPSGRATMRRVGDVLDCWFESGSMPFAQFHYPFERASWFESHFPADFVVEYIGQTRGWFYTLHVLAVALFDRPAFKTCVTHGVVLGNDGRKMSKRLGNYPEPEVLFDRYGADAMRWFLLSSPVLRGLDLNMAEEPIAETVRHVLNPIWNAWYFLSLYAEADAMVPSWSTTASGTLDRYILSKTAVLVGEVTAAMECYDLSGACAAVAGFLDALDNWYIRRSRNRFWMTRDGSESVEKEKDDAYNTLHTVLSTLTRLTAPLLPLLSEGIYRGLTGERSVHLATWPEAGELPRDGQLVSSMDRVRESCSAAHAIRKANQVRARVPLTRLVVAAPYAPSLEPYRDLIADEINVKLVELTESYAGLATTRLSIIPSAVGPRLGPETQNVIAAARRGDWTLVGDGKVKVAGATLDEHEFTLELIPTDPASTRALPGNQGVVFLDVLVTATLEREGQARDLVRLVQIARRDAGLDISDRVALLLRLPDNLKPAAGEHRAYIMEQTQALDFQLEEPGPGEPDGYSFYTMAEMPGNVKVGIALRASASKASVL